MSLHLSQLKTSPHFIERLWDLWCVCSIVGIWPRFIEPKLLFTTHHTIEIPTLPEEASGLKLLQISDLHYSSYTSTGYLQRILNKIEHIRPDVIVFTGDLISYAELEHSDGLKEFLKGLSAPLGVFAILGNHDYSSYVSLGDDGKPRLIEEHISPLLKGFYKLLSAKKKTNDPLVTQSLEPHKKLVDLLQESNIELLHNKTVQTGGLNITGLGDMMTLNCKPDEAYEGRDRSLPTIVLSHNPDSYRHLSFYPGDLMLFGHTHGGQVNLPYIWKKITPIVDKRFKKGLLKIDNHTLYINRGLGSSFPFRWFSPPELAVFTLVKGRAVTVRAEKETSPDFAYNPTPSI